MPKVYDHPPHIPIDLGTASSKERNQRHQLKVWGMIGLLIIFFLVLAIVLVVF